MTNKEVFEIIVGNLCTPGMLLSKKHSDIFGIPKKAFYNLKDKENPLAESCIDTIENIYSQIMGYDKEVLETEYELRDSRKRDKDSEYTVPGDLYHKIKNNVMPALGIKEFSHNALLTIIEIILKNIENNRVNLSKALYEIGKDCPNTVFNEYGENRIKQWRYDQKLNCLISSELPEYVGDIRENLKNKIDNKIFEQDYAVISGEAGAGKYSLAVEYAKKNKDKYEYIVIVKWNKSFNDTILNIATQDDFIYCDATELEKYGEKLKRKKEIIRNCSNVLLIIYDVDKSVESDEISRLCEDLGINIIITTNLRCRGINAEKLSYNEIGLI